MFQVDLTGLRYTYESMNKIERYYESRIYELLDASKALRTLSGMNEVLHVLTGLITKCENNLKNIKAQKQLLEVIILHYTEVEDRILSVSEGQDLTRYRNDVISFSNLESLEKLLEDIRII